MSTRLAVLSWLAWEIVACRRPLPTGVTHLSGRVMLVEPVSGALVRATLFGVADQHVLAETRTDENGAFDFSLFGASGVVVLDVVGQGGGVARDPASGDGIVLSSSHHMAVWVTDLALGEARDDIVVSAWSTLVAARARFELAHATPAQAWSDAAQLFVDHFAGNDVVTAAPLDPQIQTAAAPTPAAIHGFATVALSLTLGNVLRSAGLAPERAQFFDVLAELETDLSDGVFDGQPLADPLCPIGAEFTRTQLGLALTDFATSTDNKSGIGVDALVPAIAAISTDASALYPPLGGASASGDPRIAEATPSDGGLYGRSVEFIGTATSVNGVASVELSIDDKPAAIVPLRLSADQFAWSANAPLGDGPHTLAILASNALGTSNRFQESFTVDGTPPTLAWASCIATDDSQRTAVVVQPSGVESWGTAPPITCSSFANLSFAIYRDRLAQTSLQASVSDASAVRASASLWLNGAQIGEDVPEIITANATSIALGDFPALASSDAATLWELRLDATDVVGNASMLSAFFTLSLLATPPAVEDESATISSAASLASYSFANGNIAQLPLVSLPHGFVIARYRLSNVSQGPAFLSLTVSGLAAATDHRWRGLIAAAQSAPPLLSSTTPPVGGNTCNNSVSASFTQASIPANPQVGVATPGVGYACMAAKDFLAGGIDKTASSQFSFAVSDADSGVALVADVDGHFMVMGNQRVLVDVTVAPPAFAADNAAQCVPSFGRSPTLLLGTSSGPYAAISEQQEALAAPGGILPTSLVYSPAPSSNNGVATMTYTGPAYADCSGYALASNPATPTSTPACTGSGCRVGPGTGSGDDYAFLVMVNGSTYWTLWLSRLYIEQSVSFTGTATLAERWVAAPNPQGPPAPAFFPTHVFNLDFASDNPTPPPSDPVIYTAWP